MTARLLLLCAALATTVACDPTTPTGGGTDTGSDTEADTEAPNTMPCPEYFGGEYPPMQIDAWDYNGERVYLAAPDCCDQFRPLRSADTCEYICAPDGGFTGQGDMQCPNFYDEATHLETVWVNPDQ